MALSFIEILCIIILSYIAGVVSTVIFALNIATKKTNEKLEKLEKKEEDSTNG